MGINRTFDKHPLSSLTKGSLYFTKDSVCLNGDNVMMKYFFKSYNDSRENLKDINEVLVVMSESKPITYLGDAETSFRDESHSSVSEPELYPLFLVNNRKYILHNIKFIKEYTYINDFIAVGTLPCKFSYMGRERYLSEEDILLKF